MLPVDVSLSLHVYMPASDLATFISIKEGTLATTSPVGFSHFNDIAVREFRWLHVRVMPLPSTTIPLSSMDTLGGKKPERKDAYLLTQ